MRMDLWTSWGLLFVLGIPDPVAHCFPAIAPYRPSLKDCRVYRDTVCHLLSTTFFNGNGQLALQHRSKALLLATGWTQPTVLPLEMFMFTTPDKASLKSATGEVMITGFQFSVLEEMGAREEQTFQGSCGPRSGRLSSIDGEDQETLSCLQSYSSPTVQEHVVCAPCRTGTPRCFHVNMSHLFYRLLTAQHTFSRGRSGCLVTWSQDRLSGLGYCRG